MSKLEPEWWYRKLKEDPLRKKTFTMDHISHIEKRAGETMPKSKRWKRVLLPALSVAAAAAIIFGVLPGAKVADWIRSIAPWNNGIQGGDPGPAPPDTEDPDSSDTDVNDPEPQDPTPPDDEPIDDFADYKEEIYGKLMDRLPFKEEEIQALSVYNAASGQEIEIPEARNFIWLQNLSWMDLEAAEASEAVDPAEPESALRFHLEDARYDLPYDMASNTIEWGGERFYAGEGVLLLMSGVLQPGTPLAELDRIQERAYMEKLQQSAESTEDVYDWRRLLVDGKDFNAWESELSKSEHAAEIKTYDYILEKAGSVKMYEQGILFFNLSIVFTNERFETADGIRVGLTPEQVIGRLGKPNTETETQWSYIVGDYHTFHLYFDQGAVKYMELTMPL
ncbi:hypothetical protein AB6A23_20985 [Paenibacillus tarimensis]